MTTLSTHVLDTVQGKPASGLILHLYRINSNDDKEKIVSTQTNDDGRCDSPLLQGDQMIQASYELVFEVREYFKHQQINSSFLHEVVIRFYLADHTQSYHIPLLLSTHSYTTYRGS